MIATEAKLGRSTALGPGNFRKVAVNGFGDPHNCYAYSCVWYDDHLYIGTFRDALVLIKLRSPFDVQLPFWPVPVPESVWQADLRAQIWRYNPRTDRWQRVYLSPMITGREGFEVPLSVGFRNMAVFQGRSDPHPCIYTVTFSSSQGFGPVVLRSADGLHFEQVSEPALGLGDPNLRSFRGVRPFKGKLFATPAGSGGGQVNVSYNVAILCSDDPATGNWQMSNEPAFGDPTNLTVFEMAVFNDHLYATTLNVRQGFQVWKTDGEGPPPHKWTKVLDCGADRGPLNQAVCALCEFQGALYLGTGIQGGGIDRQTSTGPAAAELIRIYPDDRWELVVGQPRMTRQGPVFPTSGRGPGFDNFFAGYFWRLCEHDGAIYVGTYDWATFLAYTPRDQWPQTLKNTLTPEAVERLVETRAGADLWCSTDGDRWVPVTNNGMGNRFNYGIRALISTPAGLFVGTANPFGAKVAVKKEGGFVYENNPLGGLEIWHGSPEHRGGVGDGGGTLGPEGQPQWHRPDGSTPECAADMTAFHPPVHQRFVASASSSPTSVVLPPPDTAAPSSSMAVPDSPSIHSENDSAAPRISDAPHEEQHEEQYAGQFTSPDDDSPVTYSIRDIRRHPAPRTRDPLVELARADRDLLIPLETVAEEVADYFNGSPLRCVGYWRTRRVSPHRAAVDLLDQMTSLLTGHAAWSNEEPLTRQPVNSLLLLANADPVAAADALRRLGAAHHVSVARLDHFTAHAGASGAVSTNAGPSGRLSHQNEPATFDAIFWIEGPSTLITDTQPNRDSNHLLSGIRDRRQVALAAAWQRLVPGGQLIVADLVGYPLDQPEMWASGAAASSQAQLAAYQSDLNTAGYCDIQVRDITRKTWLRFFDHSRRYFLLKQMFRLIDEDRCRDILKALPGGRQAVDLYVLARATRPEIDVGQQSEPQQNQSAST